MDRYVDIPSRRMAHLAAKYVHHSQMKQIEGVHACRIASFYIVYRKLDDYRERLYMHMMCSYIDTVLHVYCCCPPPLADAVRRSNTLDENVFHVLDKMEALQNDVR